MRREGHGKETTRTEHPYFQGGKVDNAVDSGRLLEDTVECGFIRHINLEELRPPATDELDSVESNDGRIVEVVNNDNIVAILEKNEGCKGANVSGSTADHSLSTIVPQIRSMMLAAWSRQGVAALRGRSPLVAGSEQRQRL